MNTTNTLTNHSRYMTWCSALLLSILLTGCGSGDNGKDPILGGLGTGPGGGTPPVVIVPGASCSVASGPTIPTVTVSNPASGNQFVTTSTTGVVGSGKLITATFDLPMNAATINATSFTLTPLAGSALVPASISYNSTTNVATLTTSSALLVDTNYTAAVTVAATSVGPPATALACGYEWSFKTAATAAAGAPPINMGLATPFAIAATAGLANAPTAPVTTINGDVVLDPNQTCNLVNVPNDGTFGLCGGSPPVLNGEVITNTYPDTITSTNIRNDLNAAFLSITPLAGPPAVGSLGGGATIAAPTTLGNIAGSPLVLGDNWFTPGVYTAPSSIDISGDLTLDGQGDSNAMFVFQAGSALNIAAGAVSPGPHTRIILIGGAKASNVWWQVGSSATLGTFSEVNGNILAAYDITMENGATSCGRLMSGAWVGGSGALIFEANVVSIPGNGCPP